MTDYSGLVERLRSPIVSFEDNGSRRYQGLATEAASAIEAQQRELDEARAELAKVRRSMELGAQASATLREESLAHQATKAEAFAALGRMTAERDALRAAVEKHNRYCETEVGARMDHPANYRIPLPPSAAPAASEPKRTAKEHCKLFCAWKGGGPCLADDCPRRAEAGAGQVYCSRCHDYECVCVQQSASLPEAEWKARWIAWFVAHGVEEGHAEAAYEAGADYDPAESPEDAAEAEYECWEYDGESDE